MKLTMGMDACVDFQVILRQILLEAARRYYYKQFIYLNEGRTTKNKKVKSILSQLFTSAGTEYPTTQPTLFRVMVWYGAASLWPLATY
jgi:hypothetical protein